MIFVTVGVQLPFDRLIKAIDEWTGTATGVEVIAQTGFSTYQCRNIEARPYMELASFNAFVTRAELVVAHAGMGSILTALELGKPIIVMPRRAELGEHRNDHQLSTARHMTEHGLIEVVSDEQQLIARLDDRTNLRQARNISASANPDLIQGLKAFIGGKPDRSLFPRFSRLLTARHHRR